MKICETISDVKAVVRSAKLEGKVIGLVPTMGALHEGHLSLVAQAKKECDVVIVSVFVNPIQFGPNEDYDAYPRIFDQDCALLEAAGVEAVFHPTVEELYPKGYCSYVTVEGDMTKKLCGAQRPGHFKGVATVVTKLFNISEADKAFFGQKDAQQVVVLRRMIEDLNMPIELCMVPIKRSSEGLALSSRNRYLSEEEKQAALVLSKSLGLAQELFEKGERQVATLKEVIHRCIEGEAMATIDYVDIYSFPALDVIERIESCALAAIAVRIGKVRLIDNVILGDK